jgi:hypothetical protein
MHVVQEAWNAQMPSVTLLNILFYKMQCTARALRAWSHKLFSGARMELHMSNKIIQWFDLAQENRQLSTEEIRLHRDLKLRVLDLAAIERSWRMQASRLVWPKEGDACTRFFHLRANGQARKNYIPCLRKVDGNYAWSHLEKEEILHRHFHEQLGKCEHRVATIQWTLLDMPLLSDQSLDQPFTKTEVKRAIMELPAEKLPGSDSFTGVFFRACWDVIKHDILAAFQCI